MQIAFLVFKTSEENKFLGLYKKSFKKFDFEKKNFILECFQLSFHIHIVNVGQKL